MCPGTAWWAQAGRIASRGARGPSCSAGGCGRRAWRSAAGAWTCRATALRVSATAEPLRGFLEEDSLPALLRPLVRAKKTGVAAPHPRDSVTKTVYLSEGRLIFATSTDPDDRLGEMLLRKGLITYRSLEESVQAIKAGKRQGTILVESGAIRSQATSWRA